MIKTLDEEATSQLLGAILHRWLEKDPLKRRTFGNSLMMKVELKSPDGVVHKLRAVIGNADYRVTKIRAEAIQAEVEKGKGEEENGTLEPAEKQDS